VASSRPSARPFDALKAAALLMNLGLFAVGLYFELHPHDREDVLSAGGVAATAILNSAALTAPRPGAGGHSPFYARLRRVSRIANLLLLFFAVALVAVEALGDPAHALVHGAVLVPTPLLTLLALERGERGERRD
jgi:hypothetical protein